MRIIPFTGVLTALSVALASGCDPEPVAPLNDTPVVSRITLGADSFTVSVGATIEIVAAAYDQRGVLLSRLPDGGNFQWTTTAPGIAQVNDGLVTGVQPGRAIVSVRAAGLVTGARVGVIP